LSEWWLLVHGRREEGGREGVVGILPLLLYTSSRRKQGKRRREGGREGGREGQTDKKPKRIEKK